MNKQALQEELSRAESEIQVAQDRIAAIKTELDKPVGPWVPSTGDTYWSFMYGKVQDHQSYSSEVTEAHLAIANCFETEEQAQTALDRQKLKTEIINTIAELNDGWVPDWSDEGQSKYRIRSVYEHDEGCYKSLYDRNVMSQIIATNLYLKSMGALNQLKAKYTPEQLTAAYWG